MACYQSFFLLVVLKALKREPYLSFKSHSNSLLEGWKYIVSKTLNRSFSHDITILVYKANPLGIKLYFSANFIEPIWPLII